MKDQLLILSNEGKRMNYEGKNYGIIVIQKELIFLKSFNSKKSLNVI